MKHIKTLCTVFALLAVLLVAVVLLVRCVKLSDAMNVDHMQLVMSEMEVHLIKDYGYGVTDYGEELADIPKSYAMLLSYFINKQNSGAEKDYGNNINDVLTWLIDNRDLDEDGIIGWGVPIAWDAYGDGSENHENLEYTITTAIVIKSLMDWHQHASDGEGREDVLSVIVDAIRPYLDDSLKTSQGLVSYSLSPSDLPYNTYNPAAYLAGQLQRFSNLYPDHEISGRAVDVADRIVHNMIRLKKVDQEDSWYWSYSYGEDVPNDICHANYIIHGLLTYMKNQGRLADSLDQEKIISHIYSFVNQNILSLSYGEWTFYPRFFNSEINPRLYGVGMTIATLIELNDDFEFAYRLHLFAEENYKIRSGLYSRWPKEPQKIVNEYNAYYIYGLSWLERGFLMGLEEEERGE